MNFQIFLEQCRAAWPCFARRAELAAALHPADRRLQHVLAEVPGMATENKLMLLNLAVASLAAEEVYLEIGCYKGATLVGAALGNPQARIYACDNFSQFGGAAENLRRTLQRYVPAGQVEFFDLDYRELLGRAPWRPARIGAYFYDGSHSFADQFHALRDALPSLADDALIVVDDTNKRAARAANALVARRAPGFELVLDLPTPRNHHPAWWNGLQVFRFRRLSAAPAALADTGAAFAMRKFLFDDLALNFKQRRRAFNRRIKDALRALRSAPGSRR